jgi:DHA1 family bicyclomycin/chloramphenicol resistance-like MFS transporter
LGYKQAQNHNTKISNEKSNGMIGKDSPGFGEFIALMALMISMVALSLDMMLPALPEIGRELQVANRNDAQLVVSVLILGLSIGQLIYGPLSDSTGRKPAIFAGIILFALGCLLSIAAKRFEIMMVGRFIQGLGVAGPRSVVVAIVRDQYEGRAMARVMSAIMAVFILVPIVAPAVGQGILLVANWRFVFVFLLALSIVAMTWFGIRVPETLSKDDRIVFSPKRIASGAIEVCTNRISLGYTIATGMIQGSLIAYLNSAQQIYQEIYQLGKLFPLTMAALAIFVGVASLLNARIVMHWGMRALARRANLLFILLSAVYLVILYGMGGQTPLWMMMVAFAMIFFCFGILFGNLNAIAMEPLGHIAGVGAAVVLGLSNLIAVPFAIVIGRSYDGTLIPLVIGFLVLGTSAAAVTGWAD